MPAVLSAPDPLSGSTAEHYDATCPDLMDRWSPVMHWVQARSAAGVLPYCKVAAGAPGRRMRGNDAAGRALIGVTFANPAYLSLSNHPRILSAAQQAMTTFGVHSAGSAALMGLTTLTLGLEQALADFTACRTATVFPTGWGAGYGLIRALVRPTDHVVIDLLAHACLQEGAAAATPHVHRFPHLSTDGVARRLHRLREIDPQAGVLVVTESLFSMDSDSPDLGALQHLCRRHRATLMVDVAHDLGALGRGGRGALEDQGMLGEIDIVMGSFSKVFATNGGFVASNHPALRHALRFGSGPQTFSNALSPVQAAVALAALEVVQSPEGAARRTRLEENALLLRQAMEGLGFPVLGRPSGIVPVVLGGDAAARHLTAAVLDSGGIVNLVEYPAVARNACRWRLQVMADHTPDDCLEFAQIVRQARLRLADPQNTLNEKEA